MASLSAIMTKRGQAKKRIDVATEKLVEIFGIDVPPSPGNVAQSELRHALELDRLATILESILESTDPGSLDVDDDDDDDDDAETDGADGSNEDGEAKDELVSDDEASTDGSDDPATSKTETVVPAKPSAKPATAQAPKKAAASKAPATRSRKATAVRAKKRRG